MFAVKDLPKNSLKSDETPPANPDVCLKSLWCSVVLPAPALGIHFGLTSFHEERSQTVTFDVFVTV